MPQPALTREQIQEAVDAEALYPQHTQAAAALNLPLGTFMNRIRAAHKAGIIASPGIVNANNPDLLHRQIKRLEGDLSAARKIAAGQEDNLVLLKQLIRDCDVPATPPKWLAKPSPGKNTGVPCLFVSDVHYDEVVLSNQINGANAYTREIANRRLKHLFLKTIDLLVHHMAKPDYEYLVLDLGGDMVSGNIHEELRETNEAPVSQSILSLMDQLVAGIDVLLPHFPKIVVNAVVGNHGRWDKKPRMKNRVYENYEWLLYQFLAKYYAANKDVVFNIADGADLIYQTYNFTTCLTHGDQFKGGSGIAGNLCVSPETPVLLDDLSYVNAGDLKNGTKLVGFDEGRYLQDSAGGDRRKFRDGVVTSCDRGEMECLEIETDDGIKTVASLDHPWLTRSGASHMWIKTERLHLGSRILTLGPPWKRADDWKSGYLSGVLDGEGHIEVGRNNARISFGQQHNGCLQQALDILQERGIPFSLRDAQIKTFEPVAHVRLFGGSGKSSYNILRLLGELVPQRLLQEKGRQVWNGRSIQICKETRVTGLRYLGKREVVKLSTSTATFVANGMLTHNSPLMLGDARKRKRALALDQPFDLLKMGHWHTLWHAKGIMVNGSVKGYDEYSSQNNFDFEVPQQWMYIIHPEWGITARWPILLEKPGTKF